MNRHAPIPAHPSRLSAVVYGVTNLLRSLASLRRALAHRRDVKALRELDEHMLRDIGLLPGAVDGALSEPFFRDPTAVLARTSDRPQPEERRGESEGAVPVLRVVS